MATDNPFSLDNAPLEDPAAPRRKKLASFGLSGGISGTPEAPGLEEAPLYGGAIDKNQSAAEAATEPSQLSTERVQRAPQIEEATPLLGTEERVGNAMTGEVPENTYQPLSQEQRKARLQDFFNQGAGAASAAEGMGDQANDVGGASEAAGKAISYSKQANTWGSKLARSLSDLFSGGSSSPDATSSLYDTFINRLPEGLSLYGSGQTMPDFGGATLGGQEGGYGALNPADYSLGASGGTQSAGSGIGGLIGPIAGGVGGALSLASLIQQITSGNFDSSKTGAIPLTAMGMGISALPLIQSLIGPAAAGVSGGLGLSGIGLAATPMLIMSIMNMLQHPALPYGSSNMGEYQSRAAGQQIPKDINDWLLSQNDPNALLSLATGMRSLSPNQEVQMSAGGNLWGTDPYNTMLDAALQGGSGSQAMQDFLRSVEFRSGGTGEAHQQDQLLTDTYRRQLAHALGLSPEQTAGMFQEGPMRTWGGEPSDVGTVGNIDPNSWDIHQRMQNTMNSLGQFDTAQLQDLMNTIPSYGAEGYSDFGHTSPYYQDPNAGRLSPEDISAYQGLIQQAIDQQNVMNGTMPTTDPYLLSLLAARMSGGDGGGSGDGGSGGGE